MLQASGSTLPVLEYASRPIARIGCCVSPDLNLPDAGYMGRIHSDYTSNLLTLSTARIRCFVRKSFEIIDEVAGF
jgi:hypothetical protein